MNYRTSYKDAVKYTDAMEYLVSHFVEFPAEVPPGGPSPDISVQFFKCHRFIKTLEGEIVFGDCIIPGINAEEFNEYRRAVFLAGQEHNHG